MKDKKLFLTFILFLVFAVICPVIAANQETITARQRDTILLMTARENPNYDIALVLDVSGSMDSVLDTLKQRASSVVDFASVGDTLVLVRFDDSPRVPLIQEVKDQRSIGEFKSWIEKTRTTRGFGTDIQAAYARVLKVLQGLNDRRKADGKPQRQQYIVFVSDGDDIAPAHSPYRDKGSNESVELGKMIIKADQEQLINIIPVGMTFKGYEPVFKRYNPGYIPPQAPITDPDMQKFVDQLKNALNRQPQATVGSDTEKVPRAPYQVFIDQLSHKVTLEKAGMTEGEEKHSRIYKYRLASGFRTLRVENLNVQATYSQTRGNLTGRISNVTVSPRSLGPGESAQVEVTVLFPQNWSMKRSQNNGSLNLTVTGDMVLNLNQPSKGLLPTPAVAPTAATSPPPVIPVSPATPAAGTPPTMPVPTGIPSQPVLLSYPFNTISLSEAIAVEIPPEKLLYLIMGALILAIILIPAAFIYQVVVPISVTLKQGDKARAFRLANGGIISIGGMADFEIPGTDHAVAEIQRKFRRFVLREKDPGIIPEKATGDGEKGKLPLKLGEGFSLNIGGTYYEFEFLPGNREYEDTAPQQEAHYDDIDEGPSEFRF